MDDILLKNYIKDIDNITCDYLVVGSGAGGSVAAYELSKKKKDVVLIEEGNHYPINFFKGSIAKSFQNAWRYSGVTPIIGKPSFGFGEGMCLGGGTYVNGGLIWRTPDIILDEWEKKLNTDIYNKSNLNPFFSKIEEKLNVKLEKDENNYNKDSELLNNLAKKNNIKCVTVPRAVINCKRHNKCTTGCVSEAKQSTLQSYIYPAANSGLRILTKARAEKIILQNKNPYKLKVKINNKNIYIKFNKIILACGPIQTPLLIKKSFGNSCLKSKMQVHLNLRFNIIFKEKLNSNFGTIFTRQITEYLSKGILFCSANFDKSYLFSGLNSIDKYKVNELLEKMDYLATYVMQVRASSEVKINNFYSHPLLIYSLNDYDFNNIKKYLFLFSKFLFDIGAKKIYMPFNNNYLAENLDDVKKVMGKIKKSDIDAVSVHGMSSARMASNNKNKDFFDVNGKSFLHDNLFCVDSSILPTNTIESPQGTIMAFAHSIMDRLIK
tara:strand:- start:19162 stop:20640 length:1479 start_codon:yes stop_codon:yes gene_type:complete